MFVGFGLGVVGQGGATANFLVDVSVDYVQGGSEHLGPRVGPKETFGT